MGLARISPPRLVYQGNVLAVHGREGLRMQRRRQPAVRRKSGREQGPDPGDERLLQGKRRLRFHTDVRNRALDHIRMEVRRNDAPRREGVRRGRQAGLSERNLV